MSVSECVRVCMLTCALCMCSLLSLYKLYKSVFNRAEVSATQGKYLGREVREGSGSRATNYLDFAVPFLNRTFGQANTLFESLSVNLSSPDPRFDIGDEEH